MDERADWVPDRVDPELPNAARIYDYLLGGGHNFAKLVEPGVVSTPLWRPESPGDIIGPDTEHSDILAGVGRKP